MIEIRDIKAALAGRIECLCRELLPAGRKIGAEWRVGSLQGEPGQSLAVHLSGVKAGLWSDFATGHSGDVLDLIGSVKGLDTARAIRWAEEDWLGNDRSAPEQQRSERLPNDKPEWQPIIPIPERAKEVELPPWHGSTKHSAAWVYRNTDGKYQLFIRRFDRKDGGKDIVPLTYGRLGDDQPHWQNRGLPDPQPIYNLHLLERRADAPVIVVEGEKTAEAAAKAFPNCVATTWPGGSMRADKADWTPLKNRHVTIWPDHDEPGRKAAETVAAILNDIGAASVRTVEVPASFPHKWDLADDLPEGWTTEQLRGLLENAEAIIPGTSKLSVLSVHQRGAVKELPPLIPIAPELPPEMLPESLRSWLVDIADRAQIPLAMVAAPAIVGLSGVIGRAVGIRPKKEDDWTVVANLWGAAVSRPGTLKSYSMAEPLKPLKRLAVKAREDHKLLQYQAEADRMAVEAQIAAAREDLKKAAKTADQDKMDQHKARIASLQEKLDGLDVSERRYTTSDTTIEKLAELLNKNPRGMLLTRDELSGWLRSLDRADRPDDRTFYLTAWNGDTGREIDRIGRGSIDVPALTLSIYGTMQPGKLQPYVRAALHGGADDDGLLQRFQILVWPEGQRDWKRVDRKPDRHAFNAAMEIFEALDNKLPELVMPPEFDGEIPFVRFESEAQALFDEWWTELEVRLRSDIADNAPAFTSHLAKYRSLMPSLALIFHLSETVPRGELPPVSIEAARLAAVWCDFLEQHARKVYAVELTPDLAAAHALQAKIRLGDIWDDMTLRDIYRKGWSGLKDPDHVSGGFRVLKEHGIAWTAERETGANPAEIVKLAGGCR